jgi:LasA protease
MERGLNKKRIVPVLALIVLVLAGAACSRSGGSEVIYITATPLRDDHGNAVLPPTFTPDKPTDTPIIPTPNPTRTMPQDSGAYAVQPGDTLATIASLYGITVDALLAINQLPNPNALEVGQSINIPGGSALYGPDFKLIPDSELVYSAAASNFSIAAEVKYTQGFLRAYSEDVGDGTVLSGVEIIDFVATAYSVNPRLLLALLEYRGRWLSNPYPDEPQMSYPMGIHKEGREGLYRQMLDAADALNYGYYGWKYRGVVAVTLYDGQHVFYAPGLNPGTVGVQYMLSLTTESAQWQQDVHPTGFFQTYTALFGDPFARAIEPITPPNLTQPALVLPIPKGEEWVFTGGPHGAYNSGSAWAAIDLALDGDGDEHTGWTLVYLHMDDSERIPVGTRVQVGDRLAHPSCEGGVSNGTHMHLSRRYNGEWIPVECEQCLPGVTVPPFVLGEWTVFAFTGQEYQGYLTRPTADDSYRQAEQTREYEFNKLIW